jgi:hypothetical protein
VTIRITVRNMEAMEKTISFVKIDVVKRIFLQSID